MFKLIVAASGILTCILVVTETWLNTAYRLSNSIQVHELISDNVENENAPVYTIIHWDFRKVAEKKLNYCFQYQVIWNILYSVVTPPPHTFMH